MDDLIRRFDAIADSDLMRCDTHGVAYQRDMGHPVAYDDAYFDHYVKLEGGEIAMALNAGRVDLVNRHAGADRQVVDIGIGSGEFIKSRPNTLGHDVNPRALRWLEAEGKRAGSLSNYSAFCFWDVIEHVAEPNEYFRRMPDDCFLFCCLPVFTELKKIRASRHYKPNEHFYYWTEPGFIDWLAQYRFRLLERQTFETEAGRDSIVSFAFKRDLPGYHATLEQYQELHAKAYGTSAWLYFEAIAKEVLLLNPSSVIDFGCGRSDLVAHFWNDGRRRIGKYDPAIPQFKEMPEGEFDLLLATDVMEHIRMEDVGRVLKEMRAKAARALFTISMKPARAHLPDGRNAHVTLLSASEWSRWIKSAFGAATRVATRWDHILMLRTW